MLLREIIGYLQQFAPLHLAENWDNVGLLLGNADTPVLKVMTCLTITPESAAEAVAAEVDLIVSHHPILFKAVQRLTFDTPEGRMLLVLLGAKIAVYSPHTAFDNCQGGINDLLCEKLQLTQVGPLRSMTDTKKFKIVVFVPDTDLAQVSQAMFAAGAGSIGEYEQCSYRMAGTGTFFGKQASNPTVGKKGQQEQVAELRLEVLCPANRLTSVLAAMATAHSYEEPAYDVYPLEALPRKDVGSGRIGTLPAPFSLQDFVTQVGKQLGTQVQYIGASDRMVRKVAIVCGAGGSMLADAVRAQADVFLTGEMRFHDQLAAKAQGLAVTLAGHYATERPGVEMLAESLQAQFPKLQVWASREEADPVTNCLA